MALWRAVVTIDHPCLGGTGTNTWHLRSAEPSTGATNQLDGLMEQLRLTYVRWAAFMAGNALVRFDGNFIGVGPNENQFEAGDDWSVTPGQADPPMPPATAVCINWRGQSGDRSRRGRTFLGPLSVSLNDAAGTPKDPALTEIRSAAAALVTSSTGFGDGAFIVWSRQEGVGRDFVASSVRDQFASLRSRRD